ncbi:hypothetical protein FS749_016436 [Ceratobasidium sp. UAMH 11750]|nr:hypothetical protein FS749_016436 [Ceratobasidium sp. UAMH 11750]
MADPPASGPGGINEAFRRWHFTRTKLAHAIVDYLSVSTMLCTVLSSPTHHPASRRALEQALVGIDLELEALRSSEEQLAQTRITLSNARNSSLVLSSIHKLPLETLAAIFTMSNRRCLLSRAERTVLYVFPTVLAGVCLRWRQLALRTPSLWSHIDVVVGRESKWRDIDRAELWIERSRDTSLDLDIWEYKETSLDSPREPFDNTSWMVKFLTPLMPRVLDLGVFVKSQMLLDRIMECWIQNSTTATKKSLRVLNWPFARDPLLLPSENGPDEEFNNLFRSCHTFAVRGCEIFPGVPFHEGLVELRLEGLDEPPMCPTRTQLAAALTASPRLRTLTFVYFKLDHSGEILEDNPAPATLNHLEYLTIESVNTDDYQYVLPLLSIGSESLNMSMTLSTHPGYITVAESFFRRTKVTRLHAGASSFVENTLCLPMILCPIPHLQTLSISHCDFSKENLQSLYGADSNNFKHIPWPRLHSLSITYSAIDVACLQTLAQLNSIPRLNLYGVWIAGSQRPMTAEQCGVLRESLDMVDDLRISEDYDESPSCTWDFVELG